MNAARFRYRVFGLGVDSDLELPELVPVKTDRPPDLFVRLGTVSEPRGAPASGWETDGGVFFLRVPGVARFMVDQESTVTVERAPHAAPENARLYLLGTVMGVVLHQRGILPVHASAIEVSGGAVAVAGESSCGKSTIAAHLCKRGFQTPADDVTAVSFDSDGQAFVQPAFPRIKLWADALSDIDHDPKTLVRLHSGWDKYSLPIETLSQSAQPLRRVYLLTDSQDSPGVSVAQLSGHQAFGALAQSIYRFEVAEALGLRAEVFRRLTSLANSVTVLRINRIKSPGRLGELLDWFGTELRGDLLSSDRDPSARLGDLRSNA